MWTMENRVGLQRIGLIAAPVPFAYITVGMRDEFLCRFVDFHSAIARL